MMDKVHGGIRVGPGRSGTNGARARERGCKASGPELPELAHDHSPLTLRLVPQMRGLSQGAAEWWTSALEKAKKLYEVAEEHAACRRHFGAACADGTVGVTLLLRAIPGEIRKELTSKTSVILE